MTLSLFYLGSVVGYIRDFLPDDGQWIVGTIELTEAGRSLADFFAFLVSEGDVQFSGADVDKLMREENWTITDPATEIARCIELPAIYLDDHSIYWRWRS